MRRLKCWNCKKVFNEEDAAVKSECVGEFWGAPAFMDYNACPFCNSDEVDEFDEEDEEDEDVE